jgi:DivIVA domain-containing protein
MGLTPDDVQAVRFRTSRLRAGYRMKEVDDFLDQVAATITQLQDQVHRSDDAIGIWKAQAEQLQVRLNAREEESDARAHDTIPVPRGALADAEALRERLRSILREQLRLLNEGPSAPAQ